MMQEQPDSANLINVNSQPIKKQLVLDLDDTISLLQKGSRDFINAEPNWPIIDKLKQLKQEGYKLILCSARGDKRRGDKPFDAVALQIMQEVSIWLNKHELIYLFDEVILGQKRYAELYIDDKGICPEAFILGLDTAETWREFSKSAMFTQCVRNWLAQKAGKSQIHLSL